MSDVATWLTQAQTGALDLLDGDLYMTARQRYGAGCATTRLCTATT